MKIKTYILPVILFIISTSVFTACKVKKTTDHEQTNTAQYQCPMDCEDGKVYDETGQCPVCKMDLALIDNANKLTCV